MYKIILIIFVSLGFINYNPKTYQKTHNDTIYIQPLGRVNPNDIKIVTKSINSFWGIPCKVRSKVNPTNDILSKSKTRLDATKILKKFDSNINTLILTDLDICHMKRGYGEWGILGLGYRPGKTCVVSTYRLRMKVSKYKFIQRVEKVTIHEVGHNLGLDHCDNTTTCLMNDARGTIRQVDRNRLILCSRCEVKVKKLKPMVRF